MARFGSGTATWATVRDALKQGASKLANPMFLGIALFIAVAVAVFLPEVRYAVGNLGTKEKGRIIVDSPEVYTRERLINDRLEEHLWLVRELNNATNTDRIFDGFVSRSRTLAIGAGAGAGEEAQPDPKDGKDGQGSSIAFDDEFRLRSAIRDQIRQQILENQLDDRHDLFGNSLYVLKFDTTVIPNPRKHDRAYVVISIDIPSMYSAIHPTADQPGASQEGRAAAAYAISYFTKGSEKLQDWIDLFDRWQRDLASRLNESAAKDAEGFQSGKWKPDDYDELRSFIASRIASMNVSKDQMLAWRQKISSRAEFDAIVERSTNTIAPQQFAKFVAEFFGARAMKLVVGLQLDNLAYQNGELLWSATGLQIRVRPLSQYIDIEMTIAANLGDAPSFEVRMRRDRLYVTDGDCRADPGGATDLQLSQLDRWAEPKKNIYVEDAPEYLLTPDLYAAMKKGGSGLITLRSDSNKESNIAGLQSLEKCKEIEMAHLPSGLFNFIDRIARADLYSYAVLPKQSVRATVTEILDRVGFTGGKIGGADSGTGLSLGVGSTEARSGASLRAEITTFGATGKYGNEPEDKPEFGWILDPTTSQAINGRVADVGPMSASMMAIVSVPAWWEELNLSVETGWIDDDGVWTANAPSATVSSIELAADRETPHKSASSIAATNAGNQSISVVLPNSYEGIDAFLMQVKRRKPVIVEADYEQDKLTACAPANLLIRGSRLWRNSVVTIGSQEATTIKVMPNMEGILATFDQVQIPLDLAADSNKGTAKLRVWTSEGMAELRQDIVIDLPTSLELTDRELRKCPPLLGKPLSAAAETH